MKEKVDLLNGSIAKGLTSLALPIMMTSFLQMAYNMTDMIWIGRLGADAVAAVGVAGMLIWLSNGVVMIPRIGGQVKVAQCLGAQREEEAATYTKTAFQMAIFLGILFGFCCIALNKLMIGMFHLSSVHIIQDASNYTYVAGGLIIINFMNQIFTGVYTALGKSTVTLKATLVGLSINIIVDPMLIFGYGPFPKMGVMGAAIATVIAQFIVLCVFIVVTMKEKQIFPEIKNWRNIDLNASKIIGKIGFPAGVQSMMMTTISIIISRIITSFGDSAIAVQKVGTQIESVSWMTAEGFGSAVNALIAQNHGANQNDRVDKGYKTAMFMMGVWGVITTLGLIIFPGPLFKIFISEPDMLGLGVDYLMILGYSQLFMCMEIATVGAFQGLGKSFPPSVIVIACSILRVPLAYILCNTSLGLDGIWWAITISTFIKGTTLPLWFMIERRKMLVNTAI